MPAFSKIKNYAITAVVSGAICLGLGWQLGYSQVKVDKQKADLLGKVPDFSTQSLDYKPSGVSSSDMLQVWRVWEVVTTNYLEKDKLTTRQLLEGAMAGIVASLNDPYSAYLNKEQTASDKAAYAGTFGGVGINMALNQDKQIIVMSPISGSPADKAGIRSGDKIGFIDDKTTANMQLADAAKLLRGDKGTKVKVKLQHENGEIFERELTRDTIYTRSVENKEIENGKIMYIRIVRFGDTTEKEWDEAVTATNAKKISKIIIDLRNNPGGYIEAAQYINSDLLTGLLFTQVDHDGNKKEYRANHDPRLKGVNAVVLVNKGTASSSEILSGGLQEGGAAKLVGETTFGKGILQAVLDLPGDASMHLTIGKWLLPSGKWIHKVGVTPDYEVKFTEADIKAGRDVQLNKALELLH